MRLLDCCKSISDGDWIESEDQSSSGIRLIQTGNIGVTQYLDKPERAKYISVETFNRLKCSPVVGGDVLVSRLPDPIGRACIVPNDLGPAITAVDCSIIRVNTDIVDPKYLVYFTDSDSYKRQIAGYSTGTTRKRISRKNLEKISISVPSIEKQAQIINNLDKINSLINSLRNCLLLFDDLLRSRFIEMFEYTKEKHQIDRLGNVSDIVSGITKGRKTKETELEKVGYLAVSNVKDGYLDLNNIKTIDATLDEIEKYHLEKGDVLMTEGGDPDKVGRGAILTESIGNCIHQNHVFRVRLNTDIIEPMYFAHFLQSKESKKYFLKCAKQTTGIASINMKQLRALPVIIPSLRLQREFAFDVEKIYKSKFSNFWRLIRDLKRGSFCGIGIKTQLHFSVELNHMQYLGGFYG